MVGLAEGKALPAVRNSLVWANRPVVGNLAPGGGNQANIPFSKLSFPWWGHDDRRWGRCENQPAQPVGLRWAVTAYSISHRRCGAGSSEI